MNDDADFRDLFAERLQAMGHFVFSVGSVRDALRIFCVPETGSDCSEIVRTLRITAKGRPLFPMAANTEPYAPEFLSKTVTMEKLRELLSSVSAGL